jgi:hypothetical protein
MLDNLRTDRKAMMTSSEDMVIAVARAVYDINKAALDRGALSLWTVYDRPRDYPDGHIARRHEAAKGQHGPTDDVITGDLALIREAMQRCGLHRMPRAPSDDRHIVETWL